MTLGAMIVVPACAGSNHGAAILDAAECQGRVLTLPPESVVVDMRGALRCRRDHVFQDELEHRVDEEVIDYGPLSCVSGCPEGYEAQWFPQRLTLTSDGALLVGSLPASGADGDAPSDTPVGHLDEAGCFHTAAASPIVRWDAEGRLLGPQLDAPLPVRVRNGRLELLAQDRIEHVMSVQGGRVLVNGVPCGTVGGPSGGGTGELALRILPLADFAGMARER